MVLKLNLMINHDEFKQCCQTIPSICFASPASYLLDATLTIIQLVKNKNECMFQRKNDEILIQFVNFKIKIPIPINQAKIMRSGNYLPLFSFSNMFGQQYLQASEELSTLDISLEVINLRTLRRLDSKTVIKFNRMVVVVVGWPQSGVGAEIGLLIMDKYLNADQIQSPFKKIYDYYEIIEELYQNLVLKQF